jgi:glycosyltransferase involved in cell wall biosynthesis
MEKNVVVNATAMKIGGALTILHQFLEAVNQQGGRYIVFVDYALNIEDSYKNVTFIKVNTRSSIARIIWDFIGFQKFLKKNSITPSVIISLQNTTIRHNYSCPQIIYLHQPLPFSSKSWNVLNKEERSLFFYKHFYSYFIFKNLNINKDHFIVQSNWLRNMLVEDHNISSDFVHVYPPTVKLPKSFVDQKSKSLRMGKSDIFQFIFPASAIFYKNHIEIVDAVIFLKKEGKLNKKFKVVFTLNESDIPKIYHKLHKEGIQEYFEFVGHLNKSQLTELYNSSSVMLFPSYIETFGLPLIEAASFGLQIIACDEPYAREVIGTYQGASFICRHSPNQWGEKIYEMVNKSDKEASPFYFDNESDGMKSLMGLIEKVGI